MKEQLNHHQIDAFNEQGFLVIENFLSQEELRQWRLATEEAVQERLERVAQTQKSYSRDQVRSNLKARLRAKIGSKRLAQSRILLRRVLGARRVPEGFSGVEMTNQGDPDSYYSQVYMQCLRLADSHEGMRGLVMDERLGRVAAALAGIEHVRLYHDQALFKPPHGNPTAWHLDNPFWSFSARNSLTMWLALDDATPQNGCLAYLPGSHLSARHDNLDIGENFSGLLKLYPQWRDIAPVSCPVPAGSAIFHNGLTAHAAGVNMTNKARRAYTCSYMPDGATFNGTKDVLPMDYFKSLQVGDVLNNQSVNPLVGAAR